MGPQHGFRSIGAQICSMALASGPGVANSTAQKDSGDVRGRSGQMATVMDGGGHATLP